MVVANAKVSVGAKNTTTWVARLFLLVPMLLVKEILATILAIKAWIPPR